MEYMKITKSEILASFLTAVLLTVNFAPAANSAAKPAPKIGNCYNLTKAQVAADYSDVPAINCLQTHSSETYRVVKLAANDLASNYDLAKATKVCMPWRGKSKFFNYWAWFIPNPEQQSSGQNWIRCDAMIVKNYDQTTQDYTVTSWKGKRLDLR